MPLKMFIHGLESSNRGTKALFFKKKYPDMAIPNFKGDLPERMKKLESVLSGKSGITLVGSSFGGLMATLYTLANESRVDKVILLAPAIHLLDRTLKEIRHIAVPATIYHGTDDEVIPLQRVEEAAKNIFSNLTFNRVEDDHSLHRTFEAINWDQLLLS